MSVKNGLPVILLASVIVLAVAVRPTHSPTAKRSWPSSVGCFLRRISKAQMSVAARPS